MNRKSVRTTSKPEARSRDFALLALSNIAFRSNGILLITSLVAGCQGLFSQNEKNAPGRRQSKIYANAPGRASGEMWWNTPLQKARSKSGFGRWASVETKVIPASGHFFRAALSD